MPPPTIRTQAYLQSRFVVNGVGAIVPGDDDDFIATTFGFFTLPRNPGPNDDSVGTGGAGAYFSTGSMWMNSITGQWSRCVSGAPGAAVWIRLAYDGEPMGGRMTGTFPNPALAATGVTPGTYGDSSHYAVFQVQGDGTLTAAGQYPLPASFAIPTAMIYINTGTTLGGLLPIGPYTPTAGDRIFTWDGVNVLTWGIYVAAVGPWPRAADFPVGTTFNGPAYIWVADEATFFPGLGDLMMLLPPSGPGLGNPPTWTLGTDSAVAFHASVGTIVTPGTFISLMTTIAPTGIIEYQVSYTGPTSLNSWATFGGPLNVTNLNPGTLPGGVLLPPSQLTSPGVIPSGITIPYTQVSGAPAPIATSGGNITMTTTAPFITIFSLVATSTILGNCNVINTGTQQARVQMTHTDPDQGTIVQSTNVAPGTQLVTQVFDTASGLLGSGRPPYTAIQLDVQDFTAGSHTTLHIYWGSASI